MPKKSLPTLIRDEAISLEKIENQLVDTVWDLGRIRDPVQRERLKKQRERYQRMRKDAVSTLIDLSTRVTQPPSDRGVEYR